MTMSAHYAVLLKLSNYWLPHDRATERGRTPMSQTDCLICRVMLGDGMITITAGAPSDQAMLEALAVRIRAGLQE